MAAALRINASSGPPGSPQDRKRTSTDSHDGNNDKRNPSVMSDKYIHVHHYLDTGRWGTWFNDPTLKRGSGKRRLYFGTYETEYLAARAQDRAALKFKPYAIKSITCLNFAESDYELDKDLRDKLTHEQFRKLLMAESRKCYKRVEPSPCWKIFLEEEAAKGNIQIEYKNRMNCYHTEPRSFDEVLQEIVNKNKAANSEEIAKPIDEPVSNIEADNNEEIIEWIDEPIAIDEEEDKVYTAKWTQCSTKVALNHPTQEIMKELVAKDPTALPTRSGNAQQVRQATPMAAPLVLRNTRNDSLRTLQVFQATPKAAPLVLCRDARNPSQGTWPISKEALKATPHVRCESSVFKRKVWRAEGEGQSALQTSQQSSIHLDLLEWGRTRQRSMRNFSKISLSNATSINLNLESKSSSTTSIVAPSHKSDASSRNDDPELSSIETLLLLKSGWLK